MPFVKGESLRGRLEKERRLPVEDALQITREMADALAYAHKEGVIHRDVKHLGQRRRGRGPVRRDA